MNLNIVWCLKSDYEINFSKDWILEIFSEFDIVEHFDKNFDLDISLNYSLIVVSNVKEQEKFKKYLNELNKQNYIYCILHLSDEIFDHDISFYSIARKVIRTLHNETYRQKYDTFTIPVGYKTSVKKVETEKNYTINFIGQIKSDRYQMLQIFQNIPDRYFFITSQWDDPNGLNTQQYSEILSKSKFTLCPRGWDGTPIETFRLSESLECGSIPISILDNGFDYFKIVFGENYPFIVGNDWVDALKKLSQIDNFESKNIEVQNWWIEFKKKLKKKLYNLYQK